jgi:hypothetical protein
MVMKKCCVCYGVQMVDWEGKWLIGKIINGYKKIVFVTYWWSLYIFLLHVSANHA